MNYVIEINIGDFNLFFNSNVTVNTDYYYNILTQNKSSPVYLAANSTDNTYNFETDTYTSLGYRLLEITCVKLFKNAKSRAAIANKYNLMNENYESIVSQTSNAFNNANLTNRDFTNMAFFLNFVYNFTTIGTENNYTGSIGNSPNFVSTNILLVISDHNLI